MWTEILLLRQSLDFSRLHTVMPLVSFFTFLLFLQKHWRACWPDGSNAGFKRKLLASSNKNLQNICKKIWSVQHKIELVCYSISFLTGWENRPAFRHSVNNLALPVASHRNLKQEDISSSIRACYCPLDTHLEVTVNIKNTLLIISWRAVSETGT